jgi:hypothetical protein
MWGSGSVPDECVWNGAQAQKGLDNDFEGPLQDFTLVQRTLFGGAKNTPLIIVTHHVRSFSRFFTLHTIYLGRYLYSELT